MRVRDLIAVICLAGLGLYGAPTFIEYFLLHLHADPWAICVFVGDLAGCLFLFWLRFRAIAVAIYLAAGCLKTLLLRAMGVPPTTVMLLSDLAPALYSIYVLSVVILRSSVAE
jgi:hypothetical protein